MTTLSVALLVTDAKKAGAITAIATLTPDYTMGFSRSCCAIDPQATPETPATHWYCSGAQVDSVYAQAWQDAVAAAGVNDPFYDMMIFTAQNATNAPGWAATNLASQGLQFTPEPE